ncbi:MAG: ATP-binding protein, partial [Candidatus Saccharibacteria bacterium]|nr:ATP-binding protein [Rhodoferax sp.]
MNLNQDARFALRRKMDYYHMMHAWGHRWSAVLGSVSFYLYLPLALIEHLCLLWFLLAASLGGFDWTVSLSHGAVPVVVVFAWCIHGVFLLSMLAYAIEVLFNVPWGLQLPLVSPPNVEPMRLTWIYFVVIGVLGAGSWTHHILHGIAIVVEGLVLMLVYYFEPALGFIPWTSTDEQEYKRLRYAHISDMNTALTPKEPGDATYEVPFKSERSDKTFGSIHGMAAVKEKLLEPAKLILSDRTKGSEEPRNGILLHGEPGNGKTVFAQALAGELNVPIITVTSGPMSSQWLGNMPKVLANTFAYARQCAPCVLFIDEIDSFIRRRDTAGAHSEDIKLTNTLLTEVVSLRAHKVILVAATNFLDDLDAAAVREGRFDYKVEITPPDEEARVGIVQAGIARYGSQLDVVPVDAVNVSKRWNGFSVSRLMAICKALPDVAKSTGSQQIAHAQWMLALRTVQGRQGKLPGDTKSLSELVLDPQTRAAL